MTVLHAILFAQYLPPYTVFNHTQLQSNTNLKDRYLQTRLKILHYGVRRIENIWFKTYLTNRKQHVTVNVETSENTLIAFGASQGSVLSPLLFLIHIIGLRQAIKFSRVHHFADDTNLQLVDNSLKKIKNTH